MKSQAQVVVIGGGVVGCSVLYHLAKLGWRDVVLLERSELTSGSTWHAAGGFHTLNGDPNVAKLQSYTIGLYREIEELSGQDCGLHLPGGLMLAGTPQRMDFLRGAHAKGRYLGMETELISAAEAARLMPLLDPDHFIGALYDPVEGHLDPSGVTHAYAGAARHYGAEIERHTKVTALAQASDGTWDVTTDKGAVKAEHVVNAGGLWAREVGRMVGLELPVLAMEHMYILTDEMPEVVAHNDAHGELMGVIDFEGEIYLRQEGRGMLMGTYEKACVPWSERETPWDFGHELLVPDLDRIAPSLEVGFSHFPAFETAGIKQIINGPFTFAPDGNPLVGPVPGMTNFWCAAGVMAGFSQGGGVGLALANWMIDGDPGFDVWGMDIARFGAWADMAYTNAKVRENYSRRFSITFPNEELPAARPLAQSPIYGRLKEANAVFGASYGLEHALWFAPPGTPPVEEPTYKRSNAFDAVAAECRAVREAVGMIEITNFAKYKVSGPGARDWLDGLLANRIPSEGRIALAPMLNEAGMPIGDFTVACTGRQEFHLFGSGVAESYHMRWFQAHLPGDGVSLESLGLGLTGLSIAGPKARDLLQRGTDEDVSNAAFPFMHVRRLALGPVPCLAGRLSFTGDLGYELWVAPEHLAPLYDRLMDAGEWLGLRLFGGRALDSLRLEKGFGSWAREFRPIYSVFEAGLDRFVRLDKGAFIGRDAVGAQAGMPLERRLVTLAVDVADADVIGDEPIWQGGAVVGWVTSGGYAQVSQVSVALGYVPAGGLGDGGYEIEILGQRRPARLLTEPLFDPQGAKMRA